jgi:integrase
MDVLSTKESIHFLAALEGERFSMFTFTLATGMRVQEYLGLQWKDIDFERGTAVVQRAVVWHRSGGGWHFSQPKTAKSRRTIPLPGSVPADLKRYKVEQDMARLQLGPVWENNDLVFPSEIGTPRKPPNVTRHFKGIYEKQICGIHSPIRPEAHDRDIATSGRDKPEGGF